MNGPAVVLLVLSIVVALVPAIYRSADRDDLRSLRAAETERHELGAAVNRCKH